MYSSRRGLQTAAAGLVMLAGTVESRPFCDPNPIPKPSSHALRKREELAYKLAKTMKACLNRDTLDQLNSKSEPIDKLKTHICYIPSSQGYVRMGQIDINSSVDNIAKTWENHYLKKTWDSTCSDSAIVDIPAEGIKVNYTMGASGYILPVRDYAVTVHRLPGNIFDLPDFNSLAMINVDAGDPKLVPRSWRAIRATYNSILLLQPISINKTRVSFVVDVEPGGLSWAVPSLITSTVIGNRPLRTLIDLKKTLEEEEDFLNDRKLSVDEAAKKLLEKNRQAEKLAESKSLLYGLDTSRADLEATLRLLEQRLKDVKQTEVREKLDLSELRKRIESDLQTARDRLRNT